MSHLSEALSPLSPWQQITFAAAMVSRMQINYVLFCEISALGDARVFSNIMQLVWEFAAGQNDGIQFLRQQDKLETATPDPEQFEGYGVWPALDAVAGMSSLLSACDYLDVNDILAVVSLSQATIEAFLQATTADIAEADSHPLIAAEDALLQNLIEEIVSQSKRGSRKECVMYIKSWVERLGVSNIGVSLSD